MNLENAIKIVKEYGIMLREQPIKNVHGRFKSLLPHDKETIKEAIKVELIYVGTAEPRDEMMFGSLQLGFLQLASFLPDDEVVPTFGIVGTIESNDVCHDYLQYLARSEQISKHILEQTSILANELNKFCQGNGV